MKTTFFLFAIIVLASNFSCKKKPSAGLGGNAKLKIAAKHHGITIDSCTISIKFNSLDAPSNGMYDLTQKVSKGIAGESFTIFEGLKPGDYYVYGLGWDPSISNNVKGGIPYTINDETDLSIIVPVTETH
jgi:hypothetical protein